MIDWILYLPRKMELNIKQNCYFTYFLRFHLPNREHIVQTSPYMGEDKVKGECYHISNKEGLKDGYADFFI